MELPRVIGVPPIIRPQAVKQVDIPLLEEKAEYEQVIIVHSKDLSKEDRDLLQFHGKVLQWSERYVNIPLQNLPACDYLLIDVRNKLARRLLNTSDFSNKQVCAYVWFFEKNEDFILHLKANAISKIPTHSVSKEDFDSQLLSKKIKVPSLLKSFLELVLPGCFKNSGIQL
jgi:hypothetical protein